MNNDYQLKIKKVFSNKLGQELLDEWYLMYGARASYRPGMAPEEVAARDAERMFIQHIEDILNA